MIGRRRTSFLLAGMLAAAFPAAGAAAGAAMAGAADPTGDLRQTEQELRRRDDERRALDERAVRLEEERLWLSAQLVALAEEARKRDVELAELESALADLRREEAAKAAAAESERLRLAGLLAALQRLSRAPPEIGLFRPDAPADIMRSALALRNLTAALREQAAALTAALDAAADMRRRLEDQQSRVLAFRQDLDARAQQIAVLSAKREAAARQTDADRLAAAQRTARLTAQAADLRQLMEKIEQERRAAQATAQKRDAERQENERRVAAQAAVAQAQIAQAQEAARLAAEMEAQKRDAERRAQEAAREETARQEALKKEEAQKKELERKAAEAQKAESAAAQAALLGSSGLQRPAVGRLAARFGQIDRTGAESRGVAIEARAGAPVVAPAGGSIMYAGPFRNFGLILIVEHGNGYHSLLAGLGRIDVSVGRHVAAGEPLGALPPPDEDGMKELYFELRSNGRPVDPERGFADKQGKGHG